MIVSGLVPELTLEAARMASLGAGAPGLLAPHALAAGLPQGMAQALPQGLGQGAGQALGQGPASAPEAPLSPTRLDCTLSGAERQLITQVLIMTNGVVSGKKGAAAILGLPRSTLLYKLQKHGLTPNHFAQRPGRADDG